MARIVANFNPELAKVKLVGITGTNKTTTSTWSVRSWKMPVLKHLIGTISYQVSEQAIKAWNTTPESVDLCKMIYEMYAKISGCVLEVSSHARPLNGWNIEIWRWRFNQSYFGPS
jgi:UDP-N-acetylmuramoyl-L-alanyl-D-glutamate--2,6-diaminopimelate ligase